MLTLTRKPDESIIIGDGEDQIEVTVKEIRRNQVRLVITAPNHIKIFRKELLDRENEACAGNITHMRRPSDFE